MTLTRNSAYGRSTLLTTRLSRMGWRKTLSPDQISPGGYPSCCPAEEKLGAALLAGAAAVALAVWLLAPGGSVPAQPKDGKPADKAEEMFGYTRTSRTS